MKAIISARLLASPDARPAPKPFEIWDRSLRGFILRVQPTGVRVCIVQIARGRRVTIGQAGVMPPADARLRAQKVLGNVANDLAPLHGLDGSNQTSSGEFVAFFYTTWLEANRPRTWEYTLGRLKRCFGKWYRYNLKEISVELIENWKTAKLLAGMSPTTVQRDIACLSAVLTRAVKMGKRNDNPVRRVDKPRIDRNPRVRYLSTDEERRLREALRARDLKGSAARKSVNQWRRERNYPTLPELTHFADHLTPAVVLTMNTGLRRGELLALTWFNTDLTHQFLALSGEIAKAGNTRHIPLTQRRFQYRSAGFPG
jgi:hypothetical protein